MSSLIVTKLRSARSASVTGFSGCRTSNDPSSPLHRIDSRRTNDWWLIQPRILYPGRASAHVSVVRACNDHAELHLQEQGEPQIVKLPAVWQLLGDGRHRGEVGGGIYYLGGNPAVGRLSVMGDTGEKSAAGSIPCPAVRFRSFPLKSSPSVRRMPPGPLVLASVEWDCLPWNSSPWTRRNTFSWSRTWTARGTPGHPCPR